MSKIPLDLDDMYSGNVPDAIVKLTCPGYTTTEFIAPIVNDFGLSGSASMTQPFGDYMSGLQTASQKLALAGNMAYRKIADSAFGKLDLTKHAVYKSREQTIRMYQESQFGGINLDMIFIVTSRSNMSRYHDAIELSSCVYPDTNGDYSSDTTDAGGAALNYFQMDSNVLNQQLRPPCGYRIGANGIPQGTWNIQIGTYFRASGFVLESAAITQSKERLGQGEALISTVSCQFSVALDISSEQYKSWFIK